MKENQNNKEMGVYKRIFRRLLNHKYLKGDKLAVKMLNTDMKTVSTTRSTFKKSLKNLFISIKITLVKCIKEYCKNSSLHGLSYLANKNLCLFERSFFAISFVTVVIIAGFFIGNVYDKWRTTPVLFCINPQPTHIKNEPFPALTICNMNQAYKSQVMKLERNSTAYATTQILCKRDLNDTVARDIKDWNFLNNFIENISQPCENMLLECRYSGVKYNCSHLFRPTITDEGLCCSFNMVDPQFMYKSGAKFLSTEASMPKQKTNDTAVSWTAEAGYPSKLPKHFYPFKAVGLGESLGLEVILNAEADEYYCSSANTIGFKMALHSPTDPPCVKEVGILVAGGYQTKARVRIKKLQSHPQLHRVHIKHRQCLFQDESNLSYFASYSQHNCMMECVANLLMRHCGCVSYYMPRIYGNETVCSIYNLACNVNEYADDEDDDDDHDDANSRLRIVHQCDKLCFPSCSDLKYYTEVFTTPLTNTGFANNILRNLSSDYIKRNIALLTVYYKDSSYRTSVQTEFIGMTDVLSSVGGLIGLFFGFSFISLAEIVFYTFIRPCRRTLTELKNKKIKTIKSANTMRMPLFKQPYKSKRKISKDASMFGISSKVRTISPTLDGDNISTANNYMPNIIYNVKLSKDFPKPLKANWWYD